MALTRRCAEQLEAAERRIELLVREGEKLGRAARSRSPRRRTEWTFAAYLLERTPLVERVLEAALPAADVAPARLHAAMRHLLFPGGKRLRPMLAMAAAEAVGAPPERALPVAAAVELIHTYSLVHDDLPCMDDDAERRGRPTVHVAFGEATAVLAGDALQAAAFARCSPAAPSRRSRRSGGSRPLRISREAAGSRRWWAGRWTTSASTRAETDAAERVESIHRARSAALIAASIVGGALLAGRGRGRRSRGCGASARPSASPSRSPTICSTRRATSPARWCGLLGGGGGARAGRGAARERLCARSRTSANAPSRCGRWRATRVRRQE